MKHLLAPVLPVFFSILILMVPGFALQIGDPSSVQTAGGGPVYEDVAPIFEANCTMCHNGPKAPKGLQLTSYENVMKGSSRGAVVLPGKAAESEIVKRIRGISTPRMPLSGPPWLEETEMQLIEKWIEAGAQMGAPRVSEEPAVKKPGFKTRGVTYSDVAPVFRMRCVKCHNTNGIMGPPPEGLMLNSYENILDSRDRARVVPGNVPASELVRRIRGQASPRMPFDGPPYLSDEESTMIETWIAEGAMDSGGRKADIPRGAKVRLHGTLTDRWSLDGLPLQGVGRTEAKKAPSTGNYVEVRGRLGADGSVIVERIRDR